MLHLNRQSLKEIVLNGKKLVSLFILTMMKL